MLAMLLSSSVLGAILKPMFSTITSLYQAHLAAVNSHEVEIVDVAARTIALDQREAELNAAVVVAEQGNWITRGIRPLLALPVIVIAWKLIIWDKALGQWTHGHTDALDQNLWSYVNSVVIAYMGGRSIEKVAGKIAGVFRK
jgi:hypothetical protein